MTVAAALAKEPSTRLDKNSFVSIGVVVVLLVAMWHTAHMIGGVQTTILNLQSTITQDLKPAVKENTTAIYALSRKVANIPESGVIAALRDKVVRIEVEVETLKAEVRDLKGEDE